MGKTIKIGIDFGTSYSFCGYLRGDRVMPLISSSENYGVPSVFYYDKGQKLTGRAAEKRAIRRPEYAVRSVKRKLKEKEFILGDGKAFTPQEVVEEIIAGIVSGAEEQLEQAYLEEYDELEAVITVPVDFSEPMKKLIRDAAGRVRTKKGKLLRVSGVIPEPIAAAIEYFGVKGEQDANILVFDLGGGTLDVALVRANTASAGIPYEVVDQQGNRTLGGDDWDAKLAEWLEDRYFEETGYLATDQVKGKLLLEAQTIKEELTVRDKYVGEIEIRGDYIPVEITRDEFEKLTVSLRDKVRKTIKELIGRVHNQKLDHIILTGGSSYMPQIRKEMDDLQKMGTFNGNPDIRLVEPEHAIAYGAARYAATVNWNQPTKEKPMLKLKATHSYGIRYQNSEGEAYVSFLIKKGQELPAMKKTTSTTRSENQMESVFAVYESDYMGEDYSTFDESQWGTNVMTIRLTRNEKAVPKGRKSEETLTLNEDGVLTCKCVDLVSGVWKEDEVTINRNI